MYVLCRVCSTLKTIKELQCFLPSPAAISGLLEASSSTSYCKLPAMCFSLQKLSGAGITWKSHSSCQHFHFPNTTVHHAWPCEGLGIVGTIMVVVDCFCDSFCLIYLPGFPTLFQMVEALLHYLLCIFNFLKTLFLRSSLSTYHIPGGHSCNSWVSQWTWPLGTKLSTTVRLKTSNRGQIRP